MKKTLLFLFASVLVFGAFTFAEDTTTGSNHTGTGNNITITGTTATDVIACAKAALDKREFAVKGGMDAYYASWGTAFTARSSAFTDALFQPTKKDINTALNAAWKTYKTAMTAAKKAKKGAIQTAWSTYRTEVKACKGDLGNILRYENGKNDLSY